MPPLLPRALLACAWAATAFAGVIHGVAVEQASSRPLARTRVKLETLASTGPQTAASILTNRSGQFVFNAVPDGYYLVSATRPGFAPVIWSQKRAYAAGLLIAVTRDSVTFAELRLPRLGAISGRILDENHVGLPEVAVLVYPAKIPLRAAARAKSDDRGFYRLAGLSPGRYWVRTASHELEDATGLLPTFAPEYTTTRDARIIEAVLDREVPEVDLQPVAGRLVRLGGRLTGCRPGTVKITLSSDTGRSESTVDCAAGIYAFEGLSPGNYELLAEQQTPEFSIAALLELTADRDQENANLNLSPLPQVTLESEVPVLARRRDLAGEAEAIQLRSTAATRLLPGYWDMTAHPGPSRFLESISMSPRPRRTSKRGPDPDWFEIYIEIYSRNRIQVILSPQASRLSGQVTTSGSDPVPGAPVHVWPLDPETRRRLNGPKTSYADLQGKYHFEGLPPGRYQAWSSFDQIDPSGADVVVGQGSALSLPLTLVSIP